MSDRGPTEAAAARGGARVGNEAFDAPLSGLTTLRLGGPARRLLAAATDEELISAVASADAAGTPVLVLAGGSNLVIADEGFDGTVVLCRTRGVRTEARGGQVWLRVSAGEPWDELVARLVDDGLTGIECLAGIPGSTGATPIQNVGAYGQQVADTIVSVRAYDRLRSERVELPAAECGFGYRGSMFKRSERFLVLEVTFALERGGAAQPIRYQELARALDATPGSRPPLATVREAVLALRRRKGMVLDPADPDSVSAGSFFVNPILSAEEFTAFENLVHSRVGETARPPAWPEPDGRIKTSAAWAIERAGFQRGYGAGRVGISNKHTLALVNRGGATTAELVELAREIRDGVRLAFGIQLAPEPTLIGVEL